VRHNLWQLVTYERSYRSLSNCVLFRQITILLHYKKFEWTNIYHSYINDL